MSLNFRSLFVLIIFVMGFSLMPQVSLAATYDIQELTPDVKAALDSRRDRFDELRAYKEKGIVGENNRGYVELLSEDTGAKDLTNAENKDRKAIYMAIVKQNNLADSELDKVEQAFAQVQRDKANAGDKIQNPDDQWITK